MSDYRRMTRSVKHDKRQRQNKLLIFFSSLTVLFLIVFVSLLLLGNKGNPKEEQVASNNEETESKKETEAQDEPVVKDSEKPPSDKPKPKDKMLELEETEEGLDDVAIKEIESNDSNVVKAFTGNWRPIGTEQEGEHITTYEKGSADRVEIQRAVAKVTKIERDNMIEHWIGRGGEQDVIATVSEANMENIHRVYLQWIDEEGWLVTKVEQLKSYP